MEFAGLRVGGGAPLLLIAGPCVIESEAHAIETALALREITQRAGVPFTRLDALLRGWETKASSVRDMHCAFEVTTLDAVFKERRVERGEASMGRMHAILDEPPEIRDQDPPETRETLERLTREGVDPEQARLVIDQAPHNAVDAIHTLSVIMAVGPIAAIILVLWLVKPADARS